MTIVCSNVPLLGLICPIFSSPKAKKELMSHASLMDCGLMRVCVARTTAWDGVGGIRGGLTSPCRTALTKMEDSGERVTVG